MMPSNNSRFQRIPLQRGGQWTSQESKYNPYHRGASRSRGRRSYSYMSEQSTNKPEVTSQSSFVPGGSHNTDSHKSGPSNSSTNAANVKQSGSSSSQRDSNLGIVMSETLISGKFGCFIGQNAEYSKPVEKHISVNPKTASKPSSGSSNMPPLLAAGNPLPKEYSSNNDKVDNSSQKLCTASTGQINSDIHTDNQASSGASKKVATPNKPCSNSLQASSNHMQSRFARELGPNFNWLERSIKHSDSKEEQHLLDQKTEGKDLARKFTTHSPLSEVSVEEGKTVGDDSARTINSPGTAFRILVGKNRGGGADTSYQPDTEEIAAFKHKNYSIKTRKLNSTGSSNVDDGQSKELSPASSRITLPAPKLMDYSEFAFPDDIDGDEGVEECKSPLSGRDSEEKDNQLSHTADNKSRKLNRKSLTRSPLALFTSSSEDEYEVSTSVIRRSPLEHKSTDTNLNLHSNPNMPVTLMNEHEETVGESNVTNISSKRMLAVSDEQGGSGNVNEALAKRVGIFTSLAEKLMDDAKFSESGNESEPTNPSSSPTCSESTSQNSATPNQQDAEKTNADKQIERDGLSMAPSDRQHSESKLIYEQAKFDMPANQEVTCNSPRKSLASVKEASTNYSLTASASSSSVSGFHSENMPALTKNEAHLEMSQKPEDADENDQNELPLTKSSISELVSKALLNFFNASMDEKNPLIAEFCKRAYEYEKNNREGEKSKKKHENDISKEDVSLTNLKNSQMDEDTKTSSQKLESSAKDDTKTLDGVSNREFTLETEQCMDCSSLASNSPALQIEEYDNCEGELEEIEVDVETLSNNQPLNLSIKNPSAFSVEMRDSNFDEMPPLQSMAVNHLQIPIQDEKAEQNEPQSDSVYKNQEKVLQTDGELVLPTNQKVDSEPKFSSTFSSKEADKVDDKIYENTPHTPKKQAAVRQDDSRSITSYLINTARLIGSAAKESPEMDDIIVLPKLAEAEKEPVGLLMDVPQGVGLKSGGSKMVGLPNLPQRPGFRHKCLQIIELIKQDSKYKHTCYSAQDWYILNQPRVTRPVKLYSNLLGRNPSGYKRSYVNKVVKPPIPSLNYPSPFKTTNLNEHSKDKREALLINIMLNKCFDFMWDKLSFPDVYASELVRMFAEHNKLPFLEFLLAVMTPTFHPYHCPSVSSSGRPLVVPSEDRKDAGMQKREAAGGEANQYQRKDAKVAKYENSYGGSGDLSTVISQQNHQTSIVPPAYSELHHKKPSHNQDNLTVPNSYSKPAFESPPVSPKQRFKGIPNKPSPGSAPLLPGGGKCPQTYMLGTAVLSNEKKIISPKTNADIRTSGKTMPYARVNPSMPKEYLGRYHNPGAEEASGYPQSFQYATQPPSSFYPPPQPFGPRGFMYNPFASGHYGYFHPTPMVDPYQVGSGAPRPPLGAGGLSPAAAQIYSYPQDQYNSSQSRLYRQHDEGRSPGSSIKVGRPPRHGSSNRGGQYSSGLSKHTGGDRTPPVFPSPTPSYHPTHGGPPLRPKACLPLPHNLQDANSMPPGGAWKGPSVGASPLLPVNPAAYYPFPSESAIPNYMHHTQNPSLPRFPQEHSKKESTGTRESPVSNSKITTQTPLGVEQVSSTSPPSKPGINAKCGNCGKPAIYLCSGCKKTWYCSGNCQTQAWEQHYPVCPQATD